MQEDLFQLELGAVQIDEGYAGKRHPLFQCKMYLIYNVASPPPAQRPHLSSYTHIRTITYY